MIDFDKTALASRLRDSLTENYSSCCSLVIQEIAPYCESPIEVLFGATLLLGTAITSFLMPPVYFSPPGKKLSSAATLLLVPQQVWKNYRIDWVLRSIERGTELFIECDGHDFHERTKDQAERDRSRDREVAESRIPLLRFTGREIYRDSSACTFQAFKLFVDHMDGER